MKKIKDTLIKLYYRTGRLIYVLKKSHPQRWISLFFKGYKQILLETVILRYDGSGKFQEEIDFLKEQNKLHVFPYKKVKQIENVVYGYDSTKKLPYVMHKNRKLYFTRSWSEKAVAGRYQDFIEYENILGGGYMEKAPHQYQSESFHVKSSDILLDVGCAEALFALDVIDKVRKVILFESDPVWFEPLNATFEKEIKEGKVILIKKNAGSKNTAKSVTIASVLQNEEYDSLFIKMDIEGAETEVVKSCKDLMKTNKDIRFSCCTYHRQNDAAILKSIFESNEYQTTFSDGYMLFYYNIKYPYFRKGIIRASKKL
ncbi:MAG: hypothetical protein LBG15_11305 [Dysgonamonadaceae bacterium]|nr:hypothetical protein [Dysgonamonadaceae bacterium]